MNTWVNAEFNPKPLKKNTLYIAIYFKIDNFNLHREDVQSPKAFFYIALEA